MKDAKVIAFLGAALFFAILLVKGKDEMTRITAVTRVPPPPPREKSRPHKHPDTTVVIGETKLSTAATITTTTEPRLPAVQPPRKPEAPTCFPRVQGEIPPQQGQIRDCFAEVLSELAMRSDKVLEIGTWRGGGSTLVMATALALNSSCHFNETHQCCVRFLVTIELFADEWDYARHYLQNFPVWAIRGSTVGLDGLLKPEEIADHDFHYELYYERDRAIMERDTPVLAALCTQHHFDLVLMDGGEYVADAEYKIIRELCKPRYLALHDINSMKAKTIDLELRESGTVLYDEDRAGPGWGVWVLPV